MGRERVDLGLSFSGEFLLFLFLYSRFTLNGGRRGRRGNGYSAGGFRLNLHDIATMGDTLEDERAVCERAHGSRTRSCWAREGHHGIDHNAAL